MIEVSVEPKIRVCEIRVVCLESAALTVHRNEKRVMLCRHCRYLDLDLAVVINLPAAGTARNCPVPGLLQSFRTPGSKHVAIRTDQDGFYACLVKPCDE